MLNFLPMNIHVSGVLIKYLAVKTFNLFYEIVYICHASVWSIASMGFFFLVNFGLLMLLIVQLVPSGHYIKNVCNNIGTVKFQNLSSPNQCIGIGL